MTTALEEGSDNSGGTRIDDYEIINEVARGGMGIVYRARQLAPSRIVALKMILPAHLESAGAVARFRMETEAAASLDHAGILPIYAVGEKDGAPFYSMKFAEGGNLAARLEQFRDAPRASAALVADLARAVAHAHAHGILHRDLKPGNVLFDAAGKSFVSDFGLAKWTERGGDLTQNVAILGTPFYMAPEQISGARSVTAAADIYGLGAILFHLLTGRVPFQGENTVEVLRKAAEQAPPRPRSISPGIPRDLETICLKCLQKDPRARYRSASELADDLDRFLSARSVLARRANPAVQFAKFIHRNPIGAALALMAAALFIALLANLLRKDERAPLTTSLAVLPFENLSDDPANAFLASGIQEAVLVNLSRIGELKVISRASVLPYKNKPHDLRAIANALGVNAVLEGSVRRAGNRARINVALINAADNQQIWAENFDREITDTFSIESEVALRIASALQAKLSPGETARLQRKPTQSGEAYLLYLQGNDLFRDYGKLRPNLEKAEQFFEGRSSWTHLLRWLLRSSHRSRRFSTICMTKGRRGS
ncbi:MAG: protein kinase domain-containing protein [Chthoniobacterales bacterium]